MKKIQLLAVLLIIASSQAADQQTAKSSDMPIDLVADKGSYDQVAGVAVYEGNVKITQGIATIWADKVTIILKNNAAERIEADGKPAKFEYIGDQQPIRGKAKHTVYEVADKTVTLTGDAEITQGKDVIKGKQLSYQLDKEIIKGSRVKMSFQPDKKSK